MYRSASYKDHCDDSALEANSSNFVKRVTWTEKSIVKKYDARGLLQKCWKRVRFYLILIRFYFISFNLLDFDFI
jgi:hypothetical protein